MNVKLTIGLVVVLGILVLYLVVVQLPKDTIAALTPTPRVTAYLWAITPDKIGAVRLEDHVNSRAVAFNRDASGAWTLTEPGPQPADPNAATQAITALAGLTVANTITSTTELTPFGVLSPTYQLQVTLTDGTQLTAAIGDKTPSSTAYYLLRAGETNVVTINSTSMDAILALLDTPPIVPPTATATITSTLELTGTVAAPAAGTAVLTPSAATATP